MGCNIGGIVQRGLLSRKGIMLCTFGPVRRGGLPCWALLTGVVLGLVGGCGPAHYKADADTVGKRIIVKASDFGDAVERITLAPAVYLGLSANHAFFSTVVPRGHTVMALGLDVAPSLARVETVV